MKKLNDVPFIIHKEREKHRERFRLKHHKVGKDSDVMKRFYGITANQNAPIPIDENELNEIISRNYEIKHTSIVININASEDIEIKKLISILKASSLNYLPIYKDSDNWRDVTFIIFGNNPKEVDDFFKALPSNIKKGYLESRYLYYVNPMPLQLSERMRRKGEIMVWD